MTDQPPALRDRPVRVAWFGTPSRVLCTLGLIACISGCADRVPPSPMPKYEVSNEQEALRIIRERDSAVQRVHAEADVRLTGSDRKSVTLDAVMILERPRQLRLRTWKLGHAVFDITARDGEAWAFVARDEAGGVRRLTASLLFNWSSLLLGTADPDRLKAVRDDGKQLSTRVELSGTLVDCTYERATLTLTSARFPAAAPKTQIRFSNYEPVSGAAWPSDVSVFSEHGQIHIHFKNVEINGELPRNTFKPPARAEKLK